ncbi:hypothetical protein B0H17DRAFT_1185344 [Mycena rosella]|uniref:F-box domain-containing protein n=1 Tax=Mycena rosella TaxID=1033263 RepID=A0AAD7CSW1_MYCRO|nr:hypothetical protein B0H17DRAFT_1185344 [Mycena rosella]
MAPRRTLRQLLKLRNLLHRRLGGMTLDAFPVPSLPLDVWGLVLEELSDKSLRLLALSSAARYEVSRGFHSKAGWDPRAASLFFRKPSKFAHHRHNIPLFAARFVDRVLRRSSGHLLSSSLVATYIALAPRDRADWGLRYSLYWEHLFGKVGWVDKARFLLTNKGDPYLFLPEIEYTRPLHSVNVRAIPPTLAANKSFTFMTLETDTTTTLAFGPTRYFSVAAIPGPELATIIPHITLPSLRTLNINQDVDPTVLHDFLCRHFTIVSIDYRVEETQGVPAAHADTEQNNPLLQRILTGAPLALPSLSRLSCSEPAQMITLLDTFGWSPYLSSIDLDFSRESAAQVASLKRALRRLSLHLALVSFHLCTKYKSQEQWLIDDEERHIYLTKFGSYKYRRNMTRETVNFYDITNYP